MRWLKDIPDDDIPSCLDLKSPQLMLCIVRRLFKRLEASLSPEEYGQAKIFLDSFSRTIATGCFGCDSFNPWLTCLFQV